MEVSRVAKQEDATATEGAGNAVMDIVGRKPERFRHAHVAISLDFRTDVLEGEFRALHEVRRNNPHDPIVILAGHGKKAEEALVAEPDAELALDLAERASHICNKEALGIGPTEKIDAECLAHYTARTIAAANILYAHSFGTPTSLVQFRAHPFVILLQPSE